MAEHDDLVAAGQKVLVLWASAHPPVNMESVVMRLREKAGERGKVQVEHVEILQQCKQMV